MRFDKFDKQMRQYETADDKRIPDNMYIVARLDGRSFSQFTNKMKFKKPFDDNFNQLMINTTQHLILNIGFDIIYGYTQSDEISLLLKLNNNMFGRKVRKYNSILASEASSYFSTNVNISFVSPTEDYIYPSFDCRLSIIPNKELVVDYFRWRQADSIRNSLNSYTYWMLRNKGLNCREANKLLLNKTNDFKKCLLFEHDIDYDSLSTCTKNGKGLYWAYTSKKGFNPKLNVETKVLKRFLVSDNELEIGDKYGNFINNILDSVEPKQ